MAKKRRRAQTVTRRTTKGRRNRTTGSYSCGHAQCKDREPFTTAQGRALHRTRVHRGYDFSKMDGQSKQRKRNPAGVGERIKNLIIQGIQDSVAGKITTGECVRILQQAGINGTEANLRSTIARLTQSDSRLHRIRLGWYGLTPNAGETDMEIGETMEGLRAERDHWKDKYERAREAVTLLL